MGATSSKYSSNDYELAIKISKELEYLLESEFKAQGKGLHEKISSVQSQLPVKLIKRMRYCATIRNNLIHQRGFDRIPDRAGFISSFEESAEELRVILEQSHSSQAGKACTIM